MNVILFQPQIPPNTGNIARLCAASGTNLYLVPPLGFDLSEKALRRAGLDYWEHVNIHLIEDFPTFLRTGKKRFFFYSSKAKDPYTKPSYQEGDYLIFGSETSGLPDKFLDQWPEQFYTIPKRSQTRCLNLASAVSIVLYEGLRQLDFATV